MVQILADLFSFKQKQSVSLLLDKKKSEGFLPELLTPHSTLHTYIFEGILK